MIITRPDGTEVKGFYCDPKLDRSTMPNGWYAYDIRTDDDGCGIFVELCKDYVIVNNGGTFFTQIEIPELKEDGSSIEFLIDEEDWAQAHDGDCDLDTIKKVENFRMTKTDRRGYEALDEIYEKYIREIG